MTAGGTSASGSPLYPPTGDSLGAPPHKWRRRLPLKELLQRIQARINTYQRRTDYTHGRQRQFWLRRLNRARLLLARLSSG